MKSIFQYNDYREFLRTWTNCQRGRVSLLAQIARCQASYISRTLSGDVHMTPDQAYFVGLYFSFTDLEFEYFMTLVDKDRCGSFEYKSFLIKKLNQIRENVNYGIHEAVTSDVSGETMVRRIE